MSFIRRNQETLGAALLFLLLALLFMGRALFPAAGEVLGGHDMRGYYNILHEAVRDAIHNGRLPFWTPYIFNGYPLLVDPQQNLFYPPAWPTLIIPVNVAISGYMAFHIWLAGVGMYLFVRFMGSRWLPAVLAGVAFAFSGLLAGRLWAGHSTVYAIDAWTPWLALALAWSVNRGGARHGVLAGLPFGLALLAGHLPSFLYVGLIWALFAVYLLWVNPGRRLLVARQAALMMAIGLGIAAVQLVPFVQFSLASQRVATADYAFATDYSLPPAHLATLVFPQFFGEPTELGYWSVPTFEELTYYAGILPLLLLVLALRKPTRLTWFLLAVMVLGLWLALGRYGILYRLAYDFLLPFRLVRAPARAAFLYLFAVTALSGLTLSAWMDMAPDDCRRRLAPLLRWTLAVAAVAFVAAILATGALFAATHPTDTSGRLWHQIGGYAQALLLLLLGGGVLWAFLTTPAAKTGRRILLGILLVVIFVADMWLFAFKMVRLQPSGPESPWTDARALIGDTTDRVLPWGVSLFSQNAAIQTGLHSVFGYSSMEPAQHIAFTSSVPDPRSTAYDVLGVRYVIASTSLDQFVEGESGLQMLGQQGAAWVYTRPGALPVARLVYNFETIADLEAAGARVHQPDFDPAAAAIVDANPPCAGELVPGGQGTAEILGAEPGHWAIATDSATPAILLLAETAYPGWQVRIDGEPVDWFTAYTTIRGVCVPAGSHSVTWEFRPNLYLLGALISLFSWLLVGVAAILLWKGWGMRVRPETAQTLLRP